MRGSHGSGFGPKRLPFALLLLALLPRCGDEPFQGGGGGPGDDATASSASSGGMSGATSSASSASSHGGSGASSSSSGSGQGASGGGGSGGDAASSASSASSAEATSAGSGDPSTSGATSGGGQTGPSKIRYFVTAHPDDELGGWAMLEGSADHYVVFVLSNRGEQSGYCNGHGLQADRGERAPQPPGFKGKWGTHCPSQRLDSWHYFLDNVPAPSLGAVSYMGHFEGQLLSGDPKPKRCDSTDNLSCVASRGYDLWVGPRSARVAFDLGDGDTTPAEVTWAIQTARRIRHQFFPVTAEDDVVGGSYYVSEANAKAGYGAVYPHPDHHSIHLALWNTDQGVPGPQWGRTGDGDPDQAPDGKREMSTWLYDALMRVEGSGDDAFRTGVFQVAYGWLWNPYWERCESGCIASRKARHWKRH